jgi:hypothetical protein
MTGSTSDARSRLDWERVLARLELDLTQTENLLAAGVPRIPDRWEPTEPDTAMPPEMAARARDLVERQGRLGHTLRECLETVRAHRALAARLERAVGPEEPRPRYVDVTT